MGESVGKKKKRKEKNILKLLSFLVNGSHLPESNTKIGPRKVKALGKKRIPQQVVAFSFQLLVTQSICE